ncbi:MAG: hypothetical protein QF696_04545 [Acidimicrobiales bacterium]|jgi:hypothetical protein|nr:hypothetical protein [Acidimicrobiales bacterium]
MSIDDLRFAAAYRLPDGTEGLFDDIGDMVKQQLEDNKLHTASSWVFDFLTMKPIPVNDAWFIQCEHITTPMGSGIAAYSLLENAQKAATAHEVRVVNWTDLVNQQTTGLSGLTKNQHHH